MTESIFFYWLDSVPDPGGARFVRRRSDLSSLEPTQYRITDLGEALELEIYTVSGGFAKSNDREFFLSRYRLAPFFFTALEAPLIRHPPVSFISSSYIEARLRGPTIL